MLRIFAFLLTCLFSAPFLIASDNSNDTLLLKITSLAKRKSLYEVVIRIEENKEIFRADSNGYLCLTDLKPDKYTLEIRGKGFRVKTHKIEKKHFNTHDTVKVQIEPNWLFDGSESLHFSQHAYSPYWQKGSTNSLAIRGEVNLNAKYKKNKHDWENGLSIKHGVLRQGENDFLTSEDLVEVSTEYGRKFSEHFLTTALFNARTQIRKGYKIEKDGSRGELRSDFLAPAYFNFGTGMDYKSKELGISVYYSPLNSKVTIVQDSSLTRFYMPQNLIANTRRYELGSYLKINYKKEIVKNIVFQTNADFFANHLKDFGTVDVNWETKMDFKVNKYVSANILTHLIYDQDIMFDIADASGEPTGKKGPRTQFHEALNIGLIHKF
ncbi:MAG: DUF3078 domain-containing protein [Bacteroidia bacterium]